jgi:hypothetical protein
VIDAIQTSDGRSVTLKRVSTSLHPYEVEIRNLFSSDSLAKDPQNHCILTIQILHVLDDKDLVLIVMPLLWLYDDPRFKMIGEAVECFRQLFEVGWLYSAEDDEYALK